MKHTTETINSGETVTDLTKERINRSKVKRMWKNAQNYPKQTKDWLKDRAGDTTSLLTATHPIYAASEVFVAGMSTLTSIASRALVTGIAYTFMGPAFSSGRHLSRKIFGINEKSNERTILIHDGLYNAAFNLALAPPIYLLMGATPKQAVIGTGIAMALSPFMGPINGFAIDAGQDLTGSSPNDRVPHSIESLAETCDYFSDKMPRTNMFSYASDKLRTNAERYRGLKQKTKKRMARYLVATSLAAMIGIYTLNSALDYDNNSAMIDDNVKTEEIRQNSSHISLEKLMD